MESRINAGKKVEAIKMPDEEEDKSKIYCLNYISYYSLTNNCKTEVVSTIKHCLIS